MIYLELREATDYREDFVYAVMFSPIYFYIPPEFLAELSFGILGSA